MRSMVRLDIRVQFWTVIITNLLCLCSMIGFLFVMSLMHIDPIFNYNFGIAQAACEQFKEAEEALLLVTDERIRGEYCYLSWLARCFIMNG
jgi:hypothetical protein